MKPFYADPAILQRLVEFLGGDSLATATAVYITHSDGCQFQRSELHPPAELQCFLDQELDIARSLADRESLLFHLDVEYVNFDTPEEAYVDPWRIFDLQEPVVRVIESALLEWGIMPLHLITGRGHHFVWRVRLQSEVADRITALNPAPELIEACTQRLGTGVESEINRRQQEAFAATSLLMEFLAQRIKWEAAPLTPLPVEITAVHVGPGATRQREMISIDISEYGDPLHTRMVRMPYTNYLKPWVNRWAWNPGIEQQVPRFRTIPLYEMDVRQAIKFRQDEEDVKDLARRAGVRIPLQEEGTAQLLDAYLESSLRQFHEEYYAEVHDPKEIWPETYDRTPLDQLPPCVHDLLQWPNDRLLKPAGIQLVARTLLAEGWHPRHIAGLIRSKFENPAFGWGENWQDYEPATRADFYTRLFVGQWATGMDRLVDYNCTAMWEKGFCSRLGTVDCSLERHRQILVTLPHL